MVPSLVDDSADALAHDVSFLGRILGDVLREQGGSDLFDAVEGLRQACRHRRHHACEAARLEIEARVASMGDNQMGQVVRAFTVYFHLINMAEENHRLRRLVARESSNYPAPRPESIRAGVRAMARGNVPAAEVHALLQGLRIQPVFTAHPTEARRMTLLRHLRRIAELVSAVGRDAAGTSEWRDVTRRLYAEVTNLWQTDELRERQQTVLDEVRNGLYYFDSSVFEVTARVYRDMQEALSEWYPDLAGEQYDLLTFGSWMGGDRDGNPNVTPAATEETMRLHKALVLSKYVTATGRLSGLLTAASELAGVSPELLASLQAGAGSHDDPRGDGGEWLPREPYRAKLQCMQRRLMASYQQNGLQWGGLDASVGPPSIPAYATPAQFLDDLYLVQSSLRANGGKRLANDALQDLIWQVRAFGFHLARLDIRQHRDQHLQVLDELVPPSSDGAVFSTWDEAEKIQVLTTSLSDDTPPPDLAGLSQPASETMEVFSVIGRMQSELGSEAIDTYIVSFTRGASDILAVLYLAWVAGLFDPARKRSQLRAVPLFETGQDLEAAPEVMRNLYHNPVYRLQLEAWGAQQEIMLGYSDSDKDVGYLTSNWWLYRAQQQLTVEARQAGVDPTFFHGRGGAIGRGGGPLQRAILGQPAGTIQGRLKVTEQGEVLFSRYANPGIAHRHLEQMVNAVLTSSIPREDHGDREHEWEDVASRLSQAASKTYGDLVNGDPDFLYFFEEGTPLRSILRLRIASRPAQRRSGDLKLEDLRAIPWVFAWTQSRYGLPGWYGLGTALYAAIESGQGAELREMYRDWPFFRWLIDAAQISLGKADLGIAQIYANLVPDAEIRGRLEGLLNAEFRRTCEGVNAVIGQQRLLDSWPVLQRSIELRNPYVDPMSYIQARAIQEVRHEQDEQRAQLLRSVIDRSVAGIAAGLQNTG
jgi:phosphoenolpyruvate carboxylase